ncbi:MAG: HAMP domain-containing sensor histidine kinase [Leptolyngbyaceae cyanobacterium MO_188.B28]|nr:HAMP domain-containing sensor histidine kinase [Leptolyngbyaceae cyanobacterium MO_188.B28]
MSASTCQMSVPLAIDPSPDPQLALVQLFDHIRSVLVSLLSYELQTPLSTLQIAVETLAEGEAIPAQVQRRMLAIARAELKQLCNTVEGFLPYVDQVWSNTSGFLQSHSNSAVTDAFSSMFAVLPEGLEFHQPSLEIAQSRLTHFLEGMRKSDNRAVRPITPQQIALLKQRQQQVLAIVNHELRTPLATLQVCIETLQHELQESSETRQTLIEVACDDLCRLCELVRDLELLRRLEAGQVCFRSEQVDIRSTLQATLSSFLKQAPEAVLSNIWIEPSAGFLPLWTDVDRLVEVIKRLLENACRFAAASGEIKVQVKRMGVDSNLQETQGPTGDSMLMIAISDTGRGISEEQLENIFDCFHQEEGYLQRTTGGVGIGLTICRYLVEGMGGRIWAESPGKHQGSRFCFTLPVHLETEVLIG